MVWHADGTVNTGWLERPELLALTIDQPQGAGHGGTHRTPLQETGPTPSG